MPNPGGLEQIYAAIDNECNVTYGFVKRMPDETLRFFVGNAPEGFPINFSNFPDMTELPAWLHPLESVIAATTESKVPTAPPSGTKAAQEEEVEEDDEDDKSHPEEEADAEDDASETEHEPEPEKVAAPPVRPQQTKKEMVDGSTQTDDLPFQEPDGWWLQHNPALYLTPPQKWTAPDDRYWFPTVFIFALLHANLFDMQWAQDAAEKMRLPELRNFLQRKVIPQRILRNKKAGTIATALFSLFCTKLAQKAVEQMSQEPCTFFTWNSEDGKYYPHFNHMIMALWPLYIAERIGEELFFKPEK